MTRRDLLLVLALGVGAVEGCAPTSATTRPSVSPVPRSGPESLRVLATPRPGTLYDRLGGAEAIGAVVDDLLAGAVADPRITRFFAGAGPERVARLQHLLVEQIGQATGGPQTYTGGAMRPVHAGMNITDADWGAFIQDLVSALDRHGVAGQDRDDLIDLLATTKTDIVQAATFPVPTPRT